MNVKKLLLTSAVALGALTGYAQQAEVVTEYEFIPHFYIQGQIGAQETLGEGSFSKLLSPNAQVGIGYQINPLFGARLSVNLWQSKGVMDGKYLPEGDWKWKYVSPMIEGTFDLTNAFGGYNPERGWSLNLLAGLGANFASGNDDAIKYNTNNTLASGSEPLENIWSGSKTFLVGRVGVALDYNVTENLKVGLELQANATGDKYNSKRASNCDWYFNALAGVKWSFGQTYNKRTIEVPANVCAPVKEIIKETVVVRDTIVQAPTQQFVQQPVAPAAVETFTRNVFYKINSSVINSKEMAKVAEIADYMKSHPNASVHITGYADKGTGTLAINLRLARERAEAVVNALTKKYGISESRITSSSMTDHEFQPFDEPVLNRVAICVVE